MLRKLFLTVSYAHITGAWPGAIGAIIPPYEHINLEVKSITGNVLIITCTVAGVHGAVVFGKQGPCCTAPRLAAIIAATAGFAGLLHITKGIILTKGLLSIIVPSGRNAPVTMLIGKTVNGEGATPIVHFNIVVAESMQAICLVSFYWRQDEYCIFTLLLDKHWRVWVINFKHQFAR